MLLDRRNHIAIAATFVIQTSMRIHLASRAIPVLIQRVDFISR